MYINKQTTAKAGFNPNSIKNLINVKTTFKNIFHNLINLEFTIFCLQMSIQIGNEANKEKIYINKQITIMVRFNINFQQIWVMELLRLLYTQNKTYGELIIFSP